MLTLGVVCPCHVAIYMHMFVTIILEYLLLQNHSQILYEGYIGSGGGGGHMSGSQDKINFYFGSI